MISSSNVTKLIASVNSAGDLARSLAEETAELDALLALLREEQHALQERDVERVYTFASAKSERLARLDALDSSRGRFLRANGLSPDHAGMQRYLERTSGLPAAVSENWRRLLANAAEAHQINAVNGRLIAAQLRFVGGALAALQQVTVDGALPALQRVASLLLCYGADGQTRSAPGSRTLASA
jgi:flagellar biosynthesis/type III secretory pathway chaperone